LTYVSISVVYGLSSWIATIAQPILVVVLITGFAVLNAYIAVLVQKLIFGVKQKKPLVYTMRVKRLYCMATVLFVSLSIAIGQIGVFYSFTILSLLLPVWVFLSAVLIWPLEKGICKLYECEAKRKLRAMPHLVKIGITGSYGKTSVKHFLTTILSQKYHVLVTPGSVNTLMGVTRVIRENLLPEHDVFIVEMGARHVGDIKKLCRLVQPAHGIITSIGPQHLETFKSIERIIQTKYELILSLPIDGLSVFPNDQGVCRSLYDKSKQPKQMVSVCGTDVINASHIRVTNNGSEFQLTLGEIVIPCQTKLLGRHHIQNILIAAAMAHHLGIEPEQIVSGIAHLQPVEHRLQIIPTANNITVIDDTFNSNPTGASMALEVLKSFSARRIIVTPGMVELGNIEDECNHAFGKEMAQTADIAIIIGKKHADPIVEGLLEGGFSINNIHRVQSLEESTEVIKTITQAGDVILYENDLTDNYNAV